MSTFQEEFEAFEKSQGQTPVVEGQEAVSADTIVADAVAPEAEGTTTDTTPVVENVESTTQVQEVDYNKFLEESSNGLFKSVDEFKSSLPKYSEYDQLKSQKEEFEAKANENPFANDFIKKYNELLKDGKSEDQIEAFTKISKLGDLSELSPFELKVQKLVWDGFKKDVAERRINREFGLNIETEGDHLSEDEISENKLRLADAMEELRVSAKADLQALAQIKADISAPSNHAENKRLAEEAQNLVYKEKLKPVVAQIADSYNGLGVINLNGKQGEEAVGFNLELDAEFKATAAQRFEEYFMDGNTPVNEQTVTEAKNYLDAVWLSQNFKTKIAPSIFNEGYAKGKEEMVAKYENKSGLPTSGLPVINEDSGKALRLQQERAAKGED